MHNIVVLTSDEINLVAGSKRHSEEYKVIDFSWLTTANFVYVGITLYAIILLCMSCDIQDLWT